MDHALTTYGFDSLGEFLSVLYHPCKLGEKDLRTRSHRHTVAAFLKGQSKITMAGIVLSSSITITVVPRRETPMSIPPLFPHPNLSLRFATPVPVYLPGQHG
jgi:hypothetical protein